MKLINSLVVCISLAMTISQTGLAQFDDWAKQYASGLLPATDIPTAIAMDVSGKVYVTGYSTGRPYGADFFTIKYSATGTLTWSARYNSSSNGTDLAFAIRVDAASNVIVAGASTGHGGKWDYVTVKYNSAGTQQWSVSYNGPGNSDDVAVELAVDASSNVYVAGSSVSQPAYPYDEDYAVVKYNSAGVQQWAARFNGGSNSADQAAAVAVDGNGNIYVTGSSGTVKYSSAGIQQWVARNNAHAIKVDGSGNVYVTGESAGTTSYDYATVKYNSSGDQLWVARYDGPPHSYDSAADLALDASGNVYVTGTSIGPERSNDYLTVKYNPSGVLQWSARLNPTSDSDDHACALGLDASQNVYVAGSSGAVKYNSTGVQQWHVAFDGSLIGIAVEAGGGVSVTGEVYRSNTSSDYATAKYNTSGGEQWITWYDGPGNSNERANALALDQAGNVYVTGQSEGSHNDADYATIKYGSDGTQQWLDRFNHTSGDSPSGMTADGSGNIYVTGSSGTIKYNAAGEQQWRASFPGTPKDIEVDGAGHVYVAGFDSGANTYADFVVVKHDPGGSQIWVRTYDGEANSHDIPSAMALDNSGNVFVTGRSLRMISSDDYATIKYNSAGILQWAMFFDGLGDYDDAASDLAVDGAGNLYVTGQTKDPDHNYNFATVKYDSAGVQQWERRYDDYMEFPDGATSVRVGASGHIYVAGNSMGRTSLYDYAVVKYTPSGSQVWVSRYNGAANDNDYVVDMEIDLAENVYVTGYSYVSRTLTDYVTIKYDSSGVAEWTALYDSPGGLADRPVAIGVSSSREIYVTGRSSGGGSEVFSTIKYTQGLSGNLGDVNADSLCNSTDALIVLSYDIRLPIQQDYLERINAGVGDVNSDSFTNSTDALILLSFDAGMQVPFPICQPIRLAQLTPRDRNGR